MAGGQSVMAGEGRMGRQGEGATQPVTGHGASWGTPRQAPHGCESERTEVLGGKVKVGSKGS